MEPPSFAGFKTSTIITFGGVGLSGRTRRLLCLSAILRQLMHQTDLLMELAKIWIIITAEAVAIRKLPGNGLVVITGNYFYVSHVRRQQYGASFYDICRVCRHERVDVCTRPLCRRRPRPTATVKASSKTRFVQNQIDRLCLMKL